MAQATPTTRVAPKAPAAQTPAPAAQSTDVATEVKERNRKPNYMQMAHSTPTIESPKPDKEGVKRRILTAVPTDYWSFECTQPTKKDFENEDLYLAFKISVAEHAAQEALADAQARKNILQSVQAEGTPEARQLVRQATKMEASLAKVREKLQAARAASKQS